MATGRFLSTSFCGHTSASCSLLWLCKNIFQGMDKVTKLGSLRLFLEQEEVCASGCALGNGCLYTASFHPNILATGDFGFLMENNLK